MDRAQILLAIENIREDFQGELRTGDVDRMVYATDASVYQQLPTAVACPANENDIRLLIQLANRTNIGLIPRAAGTSLAGQVVGSGIVVDISKHLTRVLETNVDERWVRVQPGVIRSELNQFLAAHGLFFGPETSTSNRAMIGGMLGNNSCGSNSIVYGSMRDQTLEVTGFLSDGTRATFGATNRSDLENHTRQNNSDRQTSVLQATIELLSKPDVRQQVLDGFPEQEVKRRNMGYAIDRLLASQPLGGDGGPLNLCELIAGSEGTLFFATEIKLRCHPLPPTDSGLFCPHFTSVDQALRAAQIVMRRQDHADGSNPSIYACELIDHFILEGAARNIDQQRNLEFVDGEPAAILIVDLRGEDRQAISHAATELTNELQNANLGYTHPLHFDAAVPAIWNLRKSGLGVVANVVGDTKPVTLIEDAAVSIANLPQFIGEVNELLESKFQTRCVNYGHAGAGEIHLRPLVNLKTEAGVRQFRQIVTEIVAIVKRYRGSLSGEHGDGRLRGEFLKTMVGDRNYELLVQIKRIWDPKNLFNPGKIIDTPTMDSSLRYTVDRCGKKPETELPTIMNFSQTGGLQRAAEMCSGSGDCRKTQATGGVMCPSYMATRNEQDSTRARANVLRQVLTNHPQDEHSNPLDDERIKQVMDLCLSCKGCKAECPSNVDVGKMKAEFLHAYYQANGIPGRVKRIANYAANMKLACKLPRFSNWLMSNPFTSRLIKRQLGFHANRSLPKLNLQTLVHWFKQHEPHPNAGNCGTVLLFCDEFTNYSDVPAGIATVELLERIGFHVRIPDHLESGRTALSQGMLDQAKSLAEQNVDRFSIAIRDNDFPIVGIEPSALLTLRDEYPVLVSSDRRTMARKIARRTFLIDEFVANQIHDDNLSADMFTDKPVEIHLHGHCHQKALSSLKFTEAMLQLPKNYRVTTIPSGCCGMAGAFGYEQEHYDVSMQIGELILFPAIRSLSENSIIAAGGTSCRHQILDGTGRRSLHPVQILRDAIP